MNGTNYSLLMIINWFRSIDTARNVAMVYLWQYTRIESHAVNAGILSSKRNKKIAHIITTPFTKHFYFFI